MKSYVTCTVPMILSDLEGHFSLNLSDSHTSRNIAQVICDMGYLHTVAAPAQ